LKKLDKTNQEGTRQSNVSIQSPQKKTNDKSNGGVFPPSIPIKQTARFAFRSARPVKNGCKGKPNYLWLKVFEFFLFLEHLGVKLVRLSIFGQINFTCKDFSSFLYSFPWGSWPAIHKTRPTVETVPPSPAWKARLYSKK
jgi:hypothetical protein